MSYVLSKIEILMDDSSLTSKVLRLVFKCFLYFGQTITIRILMLNF